MKKSQEIVLSDQQNLPPNRREVMKKGLGLTLGSGALGLAGLGASTSAQSQDIQMPAISYIDKNSILYPMYDKFPNYFKKYILGDKNLNKISGFISYKTSADGLSVMGSVTLNVSGTFYPYTYDLCNFKLQYNNASVKRITDINLWSITNFKDSNSTLQFPSDELRRRLQTGGSSNPFKGDILKIYDEWSKGGHASPFNIQLQDSSGNNVNYRITAASQVDLFLGVPSPVAVGQRFVFTATRQTTTPSGTVQQGNPIRIAAYGVSTGGHANQTWNTFSRVTDRDAAPEKYSGLMHTSTISLSTTANLIKSLSDIITAYNQTMIDYNRVLAENTIANIGLLSTASWGAATTYATPDIDLTSFTDSALIAQITAGLCIVLICSVFSRRNISYSYLLKLSDLNRAANQALLNFMNTTPQLEDWGISLQNTENFNLANYEVSKTTP